MRRLVLAGAATLLVATSVWAGLPPAQAADATVEVVAVDANQLSGPLKKAGLGTLFGVASTPATPRDLIAGSQMYLSQHQSAQGDASYPTSTEAVAATLRGTGTKMIGRYNDLMGGWPYQWKGLNDWMSKVDSATRSIQSYKDVLYAVAPFNEPDNKLQGGFGTDASIPGATYDAKFNWLWTQTFRRIRAIDQSIPIMGPNFEHYSGWVPAEQDRMRAFLANAVATGTSPNLIGWHSLGPSPGDVPEDLARYYRPLETQLGVPGRPLPVVIEEYGPGTGDFEGVPGTMVKHWAEFERSGVDYASMGIYTNPGLLGNTLRRTYGTTAKPNAGWQMMHWYKSMQRQRAFVSRWDTRHYQAADGLASWDPGARNLTVLLGGEDADIDVDVTGLAARGLGPNVRVQLDAALWDVDPGAADRTVARGGDAQDATYNLFDKTMTVGSDGHLRVPIRRMEGYNGYRIVISAPGSSIVYPTKYEAENATVTHAIRYGTASTTSGGYVGGIDYADSSVAFSVNVPSAGIYTMRVRYANSTTSAATHLVSVDGNAQGSVAYQPTAAGWSPAELRTSSKRVRLHAGTNTIRLAKGAGYAELDAIDVRPDTHRYEAELAAVTHAGIHGFRWNEFPDFVGGIDYADSSVGFVVDAPADGTYRIEVGYNNGTGAGATHAIAVDGNAQGTIAYAPTGHWFDTAAQDANEGLATATVTLRAGANRIVLTRATGYAELDFLRLA
ncbi:CBM35 domain-containing protein [Dactylosporangium sp. CS-033363]|uniref:CBM35 domain-containing protein n=1 Tax=Dactylosporangium sp. CS-033363 TaxID=3239935 RepID=UPI003D8BDCBA